MPGEAAITRRTILAGAGIAGVAMLAEPANAAGPLAADGRYEDYIAAFNARDVAGFTRFYAPDVRFSLGGRMTLDGRAAIIGWYGQAWRRIREHCTIRRVIRDETGLAAELETLFLAEADWLDFTAGPLRVGDRLRRIGFIHYDINDGFFTRVATAVHRVIEEPAHWRAAS
jgi:hypothetical protein